MLAHNKLSKVLATSFFFSNHSAFNPLANLLVGGRAERDNLLLEFGSLTPLYQVNIAEWFLCEVVLEHGDPDLREFRGIRTDCLPFYVPIVIFVFFHVRIIF